MAAYDRRTYKGNVAYTVTLASSIVGGDTSISLSDGSTFPDGSAGPFCVTIDAGSAGEEKVKIASRSGNTLTVASSGRGYDGTTAASHASGVKVVHTISAVDLDEANQIVHALLTGGTTGQVVTVDTTLTPPIKLSVNVSPQRFPVEAYRSGGTDQQALTAAINAAITAGGGIVVPGLPLYQPTAALPTITLPTVSIEAPGSGACIIRPTAALGGDLLRVQTNPFTVAKAGRLRGFTLDGTNAGAGAVGLHYGDTIGGAFEDLVIEHFNKTGSVGLHLDNNTNWTERLRTRDLWLTDNTTGVIFDVTGTGTDSFGYADLDLLLNVSAGQVGILMRATARLYDGFLRVEGNTALDAGSPPTFMKLAGNASIASQLLSIHQEADGTGTAVAFNVASGSSIAGFGIVNTFGFTSDSMVGSQTVLGWWNSPSRPNAESLQLPGALNVVFPAFQEVSASGNVASTTRIEICTASGITRTFAAANAGQVVTIRNDAGTGNVTVAASGGALHGSASLTPGQFATYTSDGANVFQIG